jgi:uncharacterized protein
MIALLVFVTLALQASSASPTTGTTALPAEIPLFPLPEVVLFPRSTRPLLIYEPRYREMVADALKGDKIIGMVLLQPGFERDYDGRPPIHAVGCAGKIDDYQQLPDGRYAILVRGLTTFRILSEDQRRPYRLARVEATPEPLKDEERGTLSSLRERISMLLDKVLPLDVEPPDPRLDDDQFVNVVAQALMMPEEARQELLERRGAVERARALVVRLAR